jgi:DNA-binding NarL/FixJ family response regulator
LLRVLARFYAFLLTIRSVEIRSRHITGVDARPRTAGRRPASPGAHLARLTRREVEVLVLLAQGHSNPEIADELVISRKTVSAHLEHIYAKLGVRSRTRATLVAMQQGLVALRGANADG